ncbi:MAG TPA: CaiB/BaiF CoA-transferase family protein [Ramlibacter sp.]|nr:CaiB/BaiF CoA-transferase family protein [Ramlibacter sp.]
MSTSKALGHLRVLDLTRVLAGPLATQLLADMGAEVIKIERPATGDDTRGWGPPFLRDPQGRETAESSYFLSANRAKKSITVDIASPQGQALIRELAAHCDVLIENYKVGTLQRYGLDYAQLSEINPKLVYCSLTGFGQDGPYAPLPGYDFVFQGMGGLMSITGLGDDQEGGGPMKCGIAISDILAGMYTATAVLAAIEHRHLSGRGQYIDVALLDCVVALNSYQATNYFLSGQTPPRMGNAHTNMVPYQAFACDEGHVIVAVGNDSQFASFCAVIGRPELAQDERFSKSAQRVRNREQLIPTVAAIMRTRTMHDWMRRMEAANVPCGPINDIPQVFENPHVVQRGIKQTLPHPLGVDMPLLANPIRFGGTPIRHEQPAPMLGQHTDEVLSGLLGKSPEAIDTLRRSGAI